MSFRHDCSQVREVIDPPIEGLKACAKRSFLGFGCRQSLGEVNEVHTSVLFCHLAMDARRRYRKGAR
jgi:hypothetical protein